MTRYLLDTNIMLRARDPSASNYQLAVDAVSQLLAQDIECVITAQVLIEFWVVATRCLRGFCHASRRHRSPIAVNGLGWNIQQTKNEIDGIIDQFPLLEETPQILTNWLQLVSKNGVMGKRTHDARILAVMQVYGVTHLLTFNPGDFINISSDITIVHPQEIIR